MIENIKKAQERLFSMAVAVADILEKQEMPYMITYGTLLGAVRHKGFIPWDDDFDFYLFDETYDEAVEYLRKELPKQFFLEDKKSEPLYFHGWAHVKDLKTEVSCSLFPQDSSYTHKGLSLDLYMAKKVKLSELQHYLNEENRKYIMRRKDLGLISDEDYNRRILELEKSEKQYLNSYSDDRFVYGLINVYKCKYFELDEVFPLVKYDFEMYKFYGPNKAHEILEHIYGDYMQLPKKEFRKPHNREVKFLD